MREIMDHYFKQAKAEGYLARSVYKLKELNEKFKFIKKGMKVLDLGAAPGSWSQYILGFQKGTGFVLGVDLKPIAMKSPYIKNFKSIKGSFNFEPVLEEIAGRGPYDLIISDAAPSTSGDRFVDACGSAELAEQVINISRFNLKKGGNLVIKIFQGGDEQRIMILLKEMFEKFRAFKPRASRNESIETYYLGFGLKV